MNFFYYKPPTGLGGDGDGGVVILSAFYHKPNLTTKARSQQCYMYTCDICAAALLSTKRATFRWHVKAHSVCSSIRMSRIGFGIAFWMKYTQICVCVLISLAAVPTPYNAIQVYGQVEWFCAKGGRKLIKSASKFHVAISIIYVCI